LQQSKEMAMKKRLCLSVVFAALLVAAVIALVQPTRAAQNAPAAADVGRYQTARSPGPYPIIWMVDSTTGDTWARPNYPKWEYKGKPARDTGKIGRYQLFAGEELTVWLVDTTTGDTWYRTLNGEWESKGNPTTDAPAPK
jgi:hypothetical protein